MSLFRKISTNILDLGFNMKNAPNNSSKIEKNLSLIKHKMLRHMQFSILKNNEKQKVLYIHT